ncbi:hypothetical protein D3C87_1389590 [compost metagenome]
MKAFLVLILSSLVLSACATVDERPLTLDNEPGVASYPVKKSSSSYRVNKTNLKVTEPEQAAANNSTSTIQVGAEDLAIANRMMTAMDDYVFKNQKMDFTKLCKDKRFDCQVNDKRYPAGRKTVKRKVPPYMSGSKMGLQAEERVQVRYDFYP